jgi:hypothetical protein
MAIGDSQSNFQQFTNQIQTQQVPTDLSAVKAIDAAVAGMEFEKTFNARVNDILEGIGDKTKQAAGAAHQGLSRGVNTVSEKTAGLKEGMSPSITPTIHQANQMNGPEQKLGLSADVIASARTATVGMPQISQYQQGMHFDNSYNPSPMHTVNNQGIGQNVMAM